MGKWEGGRGGENGKKDQSGCVNHSKNLKEERKMLKKYKTYDMKNNGNMDDNFRYTITHTRTHIKGQN